MPPISFLFCNFVLLIKINKIIKMEQGIYMILNIINNKCYVGSTKNFNERKRGHLSKLRSNKHHNDYLQSSYNKYGEKSFAFIPLEEVEDINDLYTKECDWIKLKNSMDKIYGYNLGIPERNNSLSISPCTKRKILINKYNQWHKNKPNMQLDDFLNGKRAYDLKDHPGKGEKKVFGFNKITGEKEREFNSVGETIKELNTVHSAVRTALNNINRSCKGLILITDDNYNPETIYKQERKSYNYITRVKKEPTPKKVYIPKGPYKGKPVETFNLETRETIEQFNNKHELAEKYNTSVKYVNKVFEGSKKSFRGMGLRYTTN